MKFSQLVVSILAFTITSCASSSPKVIPQEARWDSVQSSRIIEIVRIIRAVGNQVWPSYGDASPRVVLVNDDFQWAINVNPAPSYYRALDVPNELKLYVSSFAVAPSYYDSLGGHFQKIPEVLYSSYSAEQTDFHYKHPIYFVKSLESFHRSGDRQSVEEWVHISIHELFHTFQEKYVRYTPDLLKNYQVPFKRSIGEDLEHQKLLKPELELLSKAACGANKTLSRKWLKDAIKMRQKRWSYIEQKYGRNPKIWEQYESFAEGTARYAEHRIMSLVARYKSSTMLSHDPWFQGFKSYEAEEPIRWCTEILNEKRKSYWYLIGFGYALALDHIDPGWKTKLRSEDGFFDGIFKELQLL